MQSRLFRRALRPSFGPSGSLYLRSVGLRGKSTTMDNPQPVNVANVKEDAPNSSQTNAMATQPTSNQDKALQEDPSEGETKRVMQAPNRSDRWSRRQRPRNEAMVGPRFEQTIMDDQPRPLAAIELIHKQPVRWVHERKTSCDGGGGPLGHPRIFINVDKPQICFCTYCGVPFAHEHHREFLESQPTTTYPLQSTADPAETPQSQSLTGQPFEVR